MDRHFYSHMCQVAHNMWPSEEPLGRRIFILSVNLIHIIIVLFTAFGWFLIPPNQKALQILYIFTVVCTLCLYQIFDQCILQIVKQKLHSGSKTAKNLNILPMSKRSLMYIWAVLAIVGLYNYVYPKRSVFCLLSKYFSCPEYC